MRSLSLSMNVFLTGGTGFVGRAITDRLLAAGHKPRLLVRTSGTARTGVEVFRGDVLDPGSLAHALEGTAAVIHLVGIISEIGKNTFANVHTRGTQNMIQAAQNAGVKRFVHMSALGTRPESVSEYHKTKWMAEEEVRRSGLNYTIFRPSLIFGPEDQFVNLFSKIIRASPIVPLLADRQAHFQPIAVENVAGAFVRCLSETGSVGKTFDLCGPEALTLRQIVEEICVVMCRRRWMLPIPWSISRPLAAFLERMYPALFAKASPLNRDQLIMLHENIQGDPYIADSLFGLKPIRLREGISRYLTSKTRSRTP